MAVVAAVGAIGTVRFPLGRLLLRAEPAEPRAAERHRRAFTQAGAALQPEAVLVVDAGFGVAARLTGGVARFVARVARHLTARRTVLSADKGRGRSPVDGERRRPLPRTHTGKTIAATPPDATAPWGVAGRTVQAEVWDNLVRSTTKPGGPARRWVVVHDPRDHEPLVLATNLPGSASALWRLSRDRWPVEQVPLAAQQLSGAHRAFVFGGESRDRLPELARLAGTIVAYVAATAAVVATGFWDRCGRPTCGRLRRVLRPVDFSELLVPVGALRKKMSVTAHVPKGVQGHRRQQNVITLPANGLRQRKAA